MTSTESERDGILCPTVRWLQDHLLPKLCKWAEEIQTNDQDRKGSLRLVPLDQYTLLYHRLKQDYGEKLVKVKNCTVNCLILFSLVLVLAFSNACSLIRCEIMPSRDVQCNTMD